MYEKKKEKVKTCEDYLTEDRKAIVGLIIKALCLVMVALITCAFCLVFYQWDDFTNKLEKESNGSYVVSKVTSIKRTDYLEINSPVVFSDNEHGNINCLVRYWIKNDKDALSSYNEYGSDEGIKEKITEVVINSCKARAKEMTIFDYISHKKLEYNMGVSDDINNTGLIGITLMQFSITAMEYNADRIKKLRAEFLEGELNKAKEVQYREQSELDKYNDEILKKYGYNIDSREFDIKDGDSPETIVFKKKITEHLKKIRENKSKDKKESEKQF